MTTEITRKCIEKLELIHRKKFGQYMTPSLVGDRAAELLLDDVTFDSAPIKVLDPAVGTGELLLSFDRISKKKKENIDINQPKISYVGFDIEQIMIDATKENLPQSKTEILSIFDEEWRSYINSFDFIIANPPYFEIKKNDSLLQKINDFSTIEERGRLNIYALFFEYCLKLLKPNGKMAFIVPPSMNNGVYFSLTRKNIIEKGIVEHIESLNNNSLFDDALTSVQIIVIKKTNETYDFNFKKSLPYIFKTNNGFIFTEKKKFIQDYWIDKKSLNDLEFSVKTGNIPWNQYKDSFTEERGDDSDNPTLPLIYSKDITKSHTLIMSDKVSSKYRFLPSSIGKYIEGPAIIVNRIVGAIGKSSLRFAYLDTGNFFIENHINVIQENNVGKKVTLFRDDKKMTLQELYEKLSSIDEKKLNEYLRGITGNTQLSAKELLFLFPISISDN